MRSVQEKTVLGVIACLAVAERKRRFLDMDNFEGSVG